MFNRENKSSGDSDFVKNKYLRNITVTYSGTGKESQIP